MAKEESCFIVKMGGSSILNNKFYKSKDEAESAALAHARKVDPNSTKVFVNRDESWIDTCLSELRISVIDYKVFELKCDDSQVIDPVR